MRGAHLQLAASLRVSILQNRSEGSSRGQRYLHESSLRRDAAVRCRPGGDSGDLRRCALLLDVISPPSVLVLSPSSFPLATQGHPLGEQTPLTLLTGAPSI